ncbi:hypothetical protein BUALT_Bualt12G0040400 [Buddleja alternifolia]|uniref:Uncharacterized protein n=1 Tax=Buddleja alternifolia TaxID=168488 RepID=A0AAV6WZ53_9LAMI|nr:hypothetical protein BUALT_Bualt12G0040400 [Buddleja alternifolia]
MEEHKKTSTKTSSATIKSSDHGHDSPPLAAAHGGESAEDEQGKILEPRKRKSNPSDVDKCEALIKKKKSPLINSNYSFTFDTKLCGGSGLESTPKFGSFNLVTRTVIGGEERVGEDGNEVDGKREFQSVD